MAIDTPAKIAVLGAGPIGLEAALYARFLGYDVEIFERGKVAEHVLRWGHVRMFSPFRMNRSSLGVAALKTQDAAYQPPDENALLTGREWAERYLLPLAGVDLLSENIREQTEVLAIGRDDYLKPDLPGSEERGESPFRLLVRNAAGEQIVSADGVIDATGVYSNPNWIGRGGIPARGELALAERLEYGVPNVLGAERATYAGRRTLVVGSGYSAATTVVALAQLADEAPRTSVVWLTRKPLSDDGSGPICRIAEDRLEGRDALAKRANELARGAHSAVKHLPATGIEAIQFDSASDSFEIALGGEHASVEQAANLVSNAGCRPDETIFRELQVHQCYATGGPMKLAAALLKQSGGDCLLQTSPGPQTLVTTEPNFYVLGVKSYGRNSNFLFAVGLEQIRDVFKVIGDREGLDLYANMEKLLG